VGTHFFRTAMMAFLSPLPLAFFQRAVFGLPIPRGAIPSSCTRNGVHQFCLLKDIL
jgi:hypothetical protein